MDCQILIPHNDKLLGKESRFVIVVVNIIIIMPHERSERASERVSAAEGESEASSLEQASE